MYDGGADAVRGLFQLLGLIVIGALILVILAGTGWWLALRPEGNVVRLVRHGAWVEVWKGGELVGEWRAEDGEVYEFLDWLEGVEPEGDVEEPRIARSDAKGEPPSSDSDSDSE